MSNDPGATAARGFLKYDEDDDGLIDRFEFQGLVAELAPLRADDASSAFDEIDVDEDGRIELDEFLRWWAL